MGSGNVGTDVTIDLITKISRILYEMQITEQGVELLNENLNYIENSNILWTKRMW